MPAKHKPPKTKAVPAAVATFVDRPFTPLEEHGRATTEEFDREQMGVAAKE